MDLLIHVVSITEFQSTAREKGWGCTREGSGTQISWRQLSEPLCTRHMALTSQVYLALRNPTSHSQFPCPGHGKLTEADRKWCRMSTSTQPSPLSHNLRHCCVMSQGLLVELANFHAPLFWDLATWHAWVNRNISGGNVSRTWNMLLWLGLVSSTSAICRKTNLPT